MHDGCVKLAKQNGKFFNFILEVKVVIWIWGEVTSLLSLDDDNRIAPTTPFVKKR